MVRCWRCWATFGSIPGLAICPLEAYHVPINSMTNLRGDSPDRPETTEARRLRVAREAVMIAAADADFAAGHVVSQAAVNAWIARIAAAAFGPLISFRAYTQGASLRRPGDCRPGGYPALANAAWICVRRGAAPFQAKGGVELGTMNVDEGNDAAVRIAAGHDGEDGEEQHIRQLIKLSLRSARIRNLCQQFQPRQPPPRLPPQESDFRRFENPP